ncbi:hydroxyisourate hydrolase [Marinitenerispora sediminis]|uniref:5-hydroxyisourate hydrolase n=1 Tax=Marinitenerispora sediminis TaxID=1931232 RepID=A0A368T1H0_9ACTN|nr:hydroxyisourate hydrolase [Marinitenerispora sediminis]RCV52753.1 hydroxyisourate hydrolase [Marinitenerispora sediminis]RCV53701.1 hydroxyisourate hydrolase [Marinitenerispora sediminis]RCV56089.1 hydroxyisourate hydrolase [Marinitenerispora sediminis]
MTTHVLDTAAGRPAAGVAVTLEAAADTGRTAWTPLAVGRTDDDGRITDLGPRRLAAGVYRLVFDTEGYFRREGRRSFYPEVAVVFEIADEEAHYHVPLLLSPFGYSTYRGS